MSDAPEREPAAAGDGEARRAEAETAVRELQAVLSKQDDPRLSPTRVWLTRVAADRGLIVLGMALGKELGCSPFCGCAANQIGAQVEPFLLERLPWARKVAVEAQAPQQPDGGLLMLKLK